jgi:hypothetical protein
MRIDFVRDGHVLETNTHHLCAGGFAAFANRIGNLAGLAEADTDFATLVAHDNQGAEIEAAPTLDYFG